MLRVGVGVRVRLGVVICVFAAVFFVMSSSRDCGGLHVLFLIAFRGLLTLDLEERLTAEEALLHPWLAQVN